MFCLAGEVENAAHVAGACSFCWKRRWGVMCDIMACTPGLARSNTLAHWTTPCSGSKTGVWGTNDSSRGHMGQSGKSVAMVSGARLPPRVPVMTRFRQRVP